MSTAFTAQHSTGSEASSWPLVPLAEIAVHRKEFIQVEDLRTYSRCRVQLHAQGIVMRDRVSGAEIKTKTQQECRVGELLVAEIDAKLGGYGIVPLDLDGAIVSSHYYLFALDNERLDKKFLSYFIRTEAFASQVQAKGSTNYAAVRPVDVLSYRVPLPSLRQQQRIVTRIEALMAQIQEVQCLQEEVSHDWQSLSEAEYFSDGTVTLTPLNQLLRLRKPDVKVESDQEYHFAGVYSFGRGVFVGQRKLGSEFSYDRLTRLREGEFVYPKLMAWEGALGIVPHQCDGLVVSPEFPVFELDRARVLPATLDTYFKMPRIWPLLSGASTGTNVRRRRLHPSEFLAHELPLPSMDTQHKLHQLKLSADEADRIGQQAQVELGSLESAIVENAIGGAL
jgi:type I restriction enzyme S subunit